MKKISYFNNGYLWWFRVYGYGLAGTSTKADWIPFTIRNGYKKTIKLFGYYIELLKPDDSKHKHFKDIYRRRLGRKK